MKHISEKVKRGGIIAGIAVLVVSQYGVAYASSRTLDVKSYQQTQLEEKYSDWYDDGEVKYAVNVFSKEWKELQTYDEQLKACQIPEELLRQLSTRELLKLVEEYPFLAATMYCYGSNLKALDELKSEFNGMRELLQREDCLEMVIEEYENLKIVKPDRPDLEKLDTDQKIVDYVNQAIQDEETLKRDMKDNECLIKCDALELILLNFITENNVGELLDLVQDKAEDKAESVLFNFRNESVFINGMTDELSYVETYAAQSSEYTVKEVKWKELYIEVLAYDKEKKNSAPKTESLLAGVSHPEEFKVIDNGSETYNCHSYAWLSDKFPTDYKRYWLNTIPGVLIGRYYLKTDYPKYVGQIAYTATHSAVIVDPNRKSLIKGNLTYDPLVRAKWAGGPVIQGPMSEGRFGMEHNAVEAYYMFVNRK